MAVGKIEAIGDLAGIRITGIPGTVRAIKRVPKEHRKKLKKGMHEAGQFLKDRSRELVPVDTGNLYRSAYFRVRERTHDVRLEVGYSKNGQAPYAIYVHEDPDAFHPIGEYKFLEKPARQYAVHLRWLIFKRLK